jgi:vacuolar-type H+-ATPase subunit C/Vma6
MTTWVDVVARARGLGTRLLTPAQKADIARSGDLRDLAARLATARSTAPPDLPSGPVAMEAAERQRAGAQLRLLARWCGRRTRFLTALFEAEDCRSIRAAVRSSGTAARSDRLVGLIPTPALPDRALVQLAGAPDLSAVAGLLAAWGSPYAAAVLEQAGRQQPDLLALEHSLMETWAGRAQRSAGRAGRAMVLHVHRLVDLANSWSALLAATQGREGDPSGLFLDGGELVTRDAFMRAVTAPDAAAAAAALDEVVRHSPLEAVTSTVPAANDRVQRALMQEQQDLARREPLGLSPVITFWLRLHAEVEAVQRVIWSLALGAPAPQLTGTAS